MKRIPLNKLLQSFAACDQAVAWADARDWQAAWDECDRGDWLLWIAARLGVERRTVVWAACKCARLALRHIPNGEKRPLKAIQTAEAWCKGKATIEQVREARRDA